MSTPSAPITAAPAAAPASTPAAASPSPVSSPAASTTPVTPSPAATPTPSSPAAPAALDSDARQAAMVAHLAEKEGTAVPTPATEQPKPGETPAEQPAAEAEAEPAAAQDTEDDGFSLEEDAFVGARDLAAKIDSDPALKAALPAEIRNEILANARIAERLAPYEQIFSSPDEAKVIAETANIHAGFVEAFTSINRNVEKGTDAIVRMLMEGTALLDENGKPRTNEKGEQLTDGTAGKFFDKIAERGIELKITNKLKALNDENLTAAWDLVMESVGLRPSTADQDQDADPALTARKAELDAQEARIRTQEQTANKNAEQQHKAAVDSETDSQYKTAVTDLLGKSTALTDLEKMTVQSQINAAFSAALKRGNPASTAYYRELDRIRQEPLSAARRTKEVALAARFTREKLVRIARPIMAEAGVSVGKKAEERAAAQAARAEAARSEVGGGRAPAPAAIGSGDAAQQEARAVEAFKAANGGREPSDEHERRVGMMLAQAKARGIAA